MEAVAATTAAAEVDEGFPRRKGERRAPADFLPIGVAAALSVAALLEVIVHGRTENARGERVLSALDPIVLRFRAAAPEALGWLFAHRTFLAAATTLFLAGVSAAALARGGRRGFPVALLSLSATVSAWAEILVLGNARVTGSFLFCAAVLTAGVAAFLRPLSLTPGFPALSPDPDPGAAGLRRRPGWVESSGLLALFLLALAARAWAVNELPSEFDEEMISVQTQSRTLAGLRQFTTNEFIGTSNGLATPLTNRLVFAGLGVSLYATRVTSLVWGLAAVPLFWGLVRRLTGGALPAFSATLLFVCAPEQLFWSRSEVSVFAPVAAVGLVFAHACLSMVRRFGTAPVFAAAALTPFCRFFYTAAHVLFIYPALLAAHAVAFAKGTRRRALLSLPVLAAGIAAWIASVSIAAALAGGTSRFVDPAKVRGESVWRAGFPASAPFSEVARGQAARVAGNLASVWTSLSYDQEYATHWYVRHAEVPGRDPMVCLGLTVLVVTGFGYLLGQPRDPRSALVLFWLGLGLLPGVLSDEPDARRLSVIFVPLLLLAALVVTAFVRLARHAGGRLAGALAFAGAGLALLGVSACGLAADLLLPAAPLARDEQIRFARPWVEESGVVLHDLFYRFGRTIEFGLLDSLLSPVGPCMQFVDRGDELLSVLAPSCDYREEFYRLTLAPGEIAARRRRRNDDERVSYLFRDIPSSRLAVSVVPMLDASARVVERDWPNAGERLLAFEVGAAARRAATSPEATSKGSRGGFLVQRAGWYRLLLDPACPGARITAGASGWDGAFEKPLLPGIFGFEISGPAGCASSTRPMLAAADAPAPFAPVLTGPAIASLAVTRGLEPPSIPGWGPSRAVLRSEDLIADFGVDGAGRIYTLVLHDRTWEIRRFSPEGKETDRVRARLPNDASTAMLLVDPDGSCLALCLNVVERFDATLAERDRTDLAIGGAAFHLARLPNGRLAVLAGSALVILGPGGDAESRWGPAGGVPRNFILPTAVVAGAGRLFVIEEGGDVHVFSFSGDPLVLRPEGRFTLSLAREPHPDFFRGSILDGEKLVVPYSPEEAPLIVDLSGRRFMTARAANDLRRADLEIPYRIHPGRRELLVLDSATRTIQALSPESTR